MVFDISFISTETISLLVWYRYGFLLFFAVLDRTPAKDWESSSAAESKAVRAQGPQHSIFQGSRKEKSERSRKLKENKFFDKRKAHQMSTVIQGPTKQLIVRKVKKRICWEEAEGEKDWESSCAAESKAVRAQGPQHSIFQAMDSKN